MNQTVRRVDYRVKGERLASFALDTIQDLAPQVESEGKGIKIRTMETPPPMTSNLQ
jgi:hypothetical protein